jgi:cell wall-associated NlpC family hydrolase
MAYRYRRPLSTGQKAGIAVVAVALAGAGPGAAAASAHHRRAARETGVPAAVIAYARAQLRKPYQLGGTGPGAYDCSGLAMEAYASAGITIQRTSQEQWAEGPQVPASQVRPGDLAFFAGGDGTTSAPGHVGIVVNAATHTMIDAYGPDGAPIRYDTYGLPGSAGGLTDPVGFTSPAARGGS